MITNVISDSLFWSSIFTVHFLFSSTLLGVWFPLNHLQSCLLTSANLSIVSLFTVKAFLFHSTDEWDSNHCELLEVASKASFWIIILVAPEGRGQNTHSHIILQQNCSYHLIVVLCWLWHSMDLLREVWDEREMMAVATPSWSFSLVQNIWSFMHWDKLPVLILHKIVICRAC
jgi:hypothetical protein